MYETIFKVSESATEWKDSQEFYYQKFWKHSCASDVLNSACLVLNNSAPRTLLFIGNQTTTTTHYQWELVCRWVSSQKLRWAIQINRYCKKIKHISCGTYQHLPQPEGKQDGTETSWCASTPQPLEQKRELKIMPSCLCCSKAQWD